MLLYKELVKKLPFLTLRYGLTYFNQPYQPINVDVIREWQYPQKRTFSQEFYTLHINLAESEEAIFNRFEKNTKYEINRAEQKDGILTETLDSKQNRRQFYDFYNTFVLTKNLPQLYTAETDLLIENDMFTIHVASLGGERIVYHTYITANSRARLFHSASLFRNKEDGAYRNLIGRANRFLHWNDIRYFKSKGYTTYDMGGISMDKSNIAAQAINKFKGSFGGESVMEYKSYVPASIKGLVYLVIKKLMGKI
jgi:hypothetical protein